MSRTIYALLVGIDKYPSPVPPLRGCVNDIKRVEALLKARISGQGDSFKSLLLTDAAATRNAVIDGFRTHLGQAKANDVALFYYSGHGSQAPSASEFWPIEPDHLDETLVCVDSRTPGKFDLADKELAKLIADVAAKGAQITVILDCCHSGSGTRNLNDRARSRRAPTDDRQRPLESYIVTPTEAGSLESTANSRSVQTLGGWYALPTGKHIVLSACRADEEAKELLLGGEQRGAFSYYLLDTLQRGGDTLSYRDLFARVNALVRTGVSQQSPQIEATLADELNMPFLGGTITAGPAYFTASFHKRLNWVIDGGSVHGIAPVSGEETTLLALFPFETRLADLKDLALSIGEAAVQKVYGAQSKVTITLKDGSQPNPGTTYKAAITSLPLPPLVVAFEGDKKALQLVRSALGKAGIDSDPSLLVKEATAEKSTLRLIAADNIYRIQRAADTFALAVDTPNFSAESAALVVNRLEHIARWLKIAELQNPASKLPRNAIQMEIFEVEADGTERLLDPTNGVRLAYRQVDGVWQQPQFKIKLTNTSTQRLWASLVVLNQAFSVWTGFLTGSKVDLKPSESVWVWNGEPVFAEIANALWQQGITETKDLLKLIVSTEEFDGTWLELDSLPLTVATSKTPTRVSTTTLQRLIARVGSRDFARQPQSSETVTDWATGEITFTTVRPKDAFAVAEKGRSVELMPGVTLLGHPSLRATARITNLATATRDLGNLALPAILRDHPELSQPLAFSSSRAGEPGLAVLELSDVNDPTLVTKESPLVLQTMLPIEKGEHILPIGFDGEFYLPLGVGKSTATGCEIRLDRLPEPTVMGTRSVTGSIKILFQKIVSKTLGFETPYPVLAVADVANDGTLNYIDNLEFVQRAVKDAQRILLFTHGILGSTEAMALSARPNARIQIAPDLVKHYDLVLTFDYENLNTRIQEVAQQLKGRLERVGLGEEHGKTLHVVAHSMGGLVTRWLIEREGGNKIVQKLVLIGTPNGGSPWATLEDWALTALGIGLNGLSLGAWTGNAVSGLLGLIEQGDVSLDQMNTDSALIKDLAASKDPGVPYHVIAGNTALIAAALQPTAGESTSLFERMLQKLKRVNLFHASTGLLFWNKPNDIAVSVSSTSSVPSKRKPAPVVEVVASDHIHYFTTKAALEAMARALLD